MAIIEKSGAAVPVAGMQSRTELLLGKDGFEKISKAKVLIFGVGGVGSWCAECLVRSGVRHLTIVDFDKVSITNCNRQLLATSKTVGMVKVEAMKERLLEINPEAEIDAQQRMYEPASADSFHMEDYDFVIDAIDSLSAKSDLILRATSLPENVTFYSSMGAALKRDPSKVRHGEFWEVQGDPLARAIRKKFKKNDTFPGRKFECVYSDELPSENLGGADALLAEDRDSKRQINGSLCHITAIFGMTLAGLVLNSILDR